MREGGCTSRLPLAVHVRRLLPPVLRIGAASLRRTRAMSTPESGSPNLLDEFFSASPTTGLPEEATDDVAKASPEPVAEEAPEVAEEAPEEAADEAVEVDEVEAVDAVAEALPLI